jgi:hypothetical protein
MGVRHAETAREAWSRKRRKHLIASTTRGDGASTIHLHPVRTHTELARADPTAPPAGSPIRPRGCGFSHRCCGWSVTNGHAPAAVTQPHLLTHYACTTLALHCACPSHPVSLTTPIHLPTRGRVPCCGTMPAYGRPRVCTPPPCPTNLPSASPTAAAAAALTAAATLAVAALAAAFAAATLNCHRHCHDLVRRRPGCAAGPHDRAARAAAAPCAPRCAAPAAPRSLPRVPTETARKSKVARAFCKGSTILADIPRTTPGSRHFTVQI